MELRVAHVNSTCTTLILHSFGYSMDLDSFKNQAKDAVKRFDNQDSAFHRTSKDYDGETYRHHVDSHGCIVATTISGQKLNPVMTEIGFTNVGTTYPSKSESEMTMWYIPVDLFLRSIK